MTCSQTPMCSRDLSVEPLIFVAMALAPSLFWLWICLRKNSYRLEPRRLLATTFQLGMLATLPAGAI